jgi:hypothetical protein
MLFHQVCVCEVCVHSNTYGAVSAVPLASSSTDTGPRTQPTHPPTSPGSSHSGPVCDINKAVAHHASAIGVEGLVAVPSSGPPLREQAIQEGFVL